MTTNNYETTKSHQEKIQSEIVKKTGRTEQLPYQLSEVIHAHASRFLKTVDDSFETDCEKGCSYCCHQPATVFPFEAIQIAQRLKDSLLKSQLDALIEKLKARVKGFAGNSVQKNINNKTACPLLTTPSTHGECSIYENRPLTCRMAHSFSKKKCRISFQKDRTQVEIPVSLEMMTGISGIIEAAFERLPKLNLDGNLYELCSAVLAALNNPDAGAKWAKGDLSIFKNCIKDDT